MSVASGTISQTDLTGNNYLFTDTGTYSAPVTSRILTQYDPNGNLINTYNMGANLTQAIAVTADGWNSFKLNVTDNTGPLATFVLNYLFEGIFIAAALNTIAASDCGCGPSKPWSLLKGMFAEAGAEWSALGGLGVQANTLITRANIYINTVLTS